MNGQLELDLGAQSNESNKYKRISDLDMYQKVAKSTTIYPREQAIIYPSLGLTGEAGEIANKVKKIIRDGTNKNIIQEISNEIGDVLWYVALLADDIGCKLSDIANDNLIKLANRKKTAQSTVLATKDSRTKQEHSCAFLHSP
jgi:NTP pyrophosphatase (non-canonical NTP hydrolase)